MTVQDPSLEGTIQMPLRGMFFYLPSLGIFVSLRLQLTLLGVACFKQLLLHKWRLSNPQPATSRLGMQNGRLCMVHNIRFFQSITSPTFTLNKFEYFNTSGYRFVHGDGYSELAPRV